MAKGKRRRNATWRVVNGVKHGFPAPSATSLCNAFRLSETTEVRGGEEECRACAIAVDQRW